MMAGNFLWNTVTLYISRRNFGQPEAHQKEVLEDE
jgi:hypothetical protein